MRLRRLAAPLTLAFLIHPAHGDAATRRAEPLVTARVSIVLTAPVPLSRGQLRAMTREVEAIWQPYGVVLTWRAPGATASAPTPAGIRLQAAFVRHDRARDVQGNSGAVALGGVQFLDANPADQVLMLWADDVIAAVMSARWNGYPVDRLSPAMVDDLSGRALGRVLAHELGHYLLALRTHTQTGLMRRSFPNRELAGLDRDGFRLDAAACLRLRSHLAELLVSSASPSMLDRP